VALSVSLCLLRKLWYVLLLKMRLSWIDWWLWTRWRHIGRLLRRHRVAWTRRKSWRWLQYRRALSVAVRRSDRRFWRWMLCRTETVLRCFEYWRLLRVRRRRSDWRFWRRLFRRAGTVLRWLQDWWLLGEGARRR
jgi:hypothetical protein